MMMLLVIASATATTVTASGTGTSAGIPATCTVAAAAADYDNKATATEHTTLTHMQPTCVTQQSDDVCAAVSTEQQRATDQDSVCTFTDTKSRA